jgi:hypothetical protein
MGGTLNGREALAMNIGTAAEGAGCQAGFRQRGAAAFDAATAREEERMGIAREETGDARRVRPAAAEEGSPACAPGNRRWASCPRRGPQDVVADLFDQAAQVQTVQFGEVFGAEVEGGIGGQLLLDSIAGGDDGRVIRAGPWRWAISGKLSVVSPRQRWAITERASTTRLWRPLPTISP